jgi:hypothetical protein
MSRSLWREYEEVEAQRRAGWPHPGPWPCQWEVQGGGAVCGFPATVKPLDLGPRCTMHLPDMEEHRAYWKRVKDRGAPTHDR